MSKQPIYIYGTDRTSPLKVVKRSVRDGIVKYNNASYRTFDNNGKTSILADDPITHPLQRYDDDFVINRALAILKARVMSGEFLESPDAVKQLFMLRSKGIKREVFTVVFLNNKHKVLSFYDHTLGDIDSAHVYPNIIIAEALKLGAPAIVLHHNHPNLSNPNPSKADRDITVKIKKAANMFSIRVLDHIISSGDKSYSFAENGDM